MKTFRRRPFLVGEISFNYYDLANRENLQYFDVAKLLIDKCKMSGVNGVNFHVGDSEFLHCGHDNELIEDQLTLDEYKQLARYAKQLDLVFIITPANENIVDELDEFVDVYKIASGDLTNIPFIDYISKKQKPILLGTGASNIKEIKAAIDCIEDNSNFNTVIMHAVLSYPTKLRDANLLMIKDLSESFEGYEVGYSDYTIYDNYMFTLTTAYNYGAVVLEKYFTLDKSLENHKFSIDEEDVRIFNLNMDVLSKINGFKNKQQLICESYSRNCVRKSICAKKDIKMGELINESDIIIKRPGSGISPSEIDNVIGKKANKTISKGSLIDYDMLS